MKTPDIPQETQPCPNLLEASNAYHSYAQLLLLALDTRILFLRAGINEPVRLTLLIDGEEYSPAQMKLTVQPTEASPNEPAETAE